MRPEIAHCYQPLSSQESGKVLDILSKHNQSASLIIEQPRENDHRLLVLPPNQDRDGIFLGTNIITDRSLVEIEISLPGFIPEYLSAEGRIAILGNGFSSVPEWAIKRYQSGRLKHPPVVADVIDYPTAEEELGYLIDDLASVGIQMYTQKGRTLQETWSQIRRLNKAFIQGNAINVNYLFGSNCPPSELQELSLALNFFGPPLSTLEEQIGLLSSDGRLFIKQVSDISRLPVGYANRQLETHAYCITRRPIATNSLKQTSLIV